MSSPHPAPASRPAHSRPRPVPDLQLSVWATAQQDARTQRRGRYLPASTAHPAKMLPAIAATAITRYTQPGDLVADPMCGIGTTLVEAIHLGRDAIGVEFEDRWAQIAAANISWARRHGAVGAGQVIRGDARQLTSLLPPGMAGRAALVVTSPPYGPSVHGQVRAEQRSGGGGVEKYDNRYSRDPANLAHHGLDDMLAGFTQILAGCRALLRPGGVAVVTARPWRHHGELVDLPAAVLAAGQAAGLIPAARYVALLAGLRGGKLIPRPSFFQLDNIRKARRRGQPWHLIVHEDVLVFSVPPVGGAAELAVSRPEPGRRSSLLAIAQPGQDRQQAA
jgi:modification methylase